MRKVVRPHSRRHVWIYDEDWDYIQQHTLRVNLAPGTWVREIIHKIVMQLREDRHLTREAAMKLLEVAEKGEEENG